MSEIEYTPSETPPNSGYGSSKERRQSMTLPDRLLRDSVRIRQASLLNMDADAAAGLMENRRSIEFSNRQTNRVQEAMVARTIGQEPAEGKATMPDDDEDTGNVTTSLGDTFTEHHHYPTPTPPPKPRSPLSTLVMTAILSAVGGGLLSTAIPHVANWLTKSEKPVVEQPIKPDTDTQYEFGISSGKPEFPSEPVN